HPISLIRHINITIYSSVNQPFTLSVTPALLPQTPHQLRNGPLQRHIICLEECHSLLRLLSHHIRIHLAALIRHLCRHDKDLPVRRVFLQLPCEHFQQPVRQAAYTEEIGRASCRERVESAEGGVAVDEYGAGVGGG